MKHPADAPLLSNFVCQIVEISVLQYAEAII